MRLVSGPVIRFRCSCGCVNEGDEHEFKEQHTMPPSWLATCAFCKKEQRVFPEALLQKAAISYANARFG